MLRLNVIATQVRLGLLRNPEVLYSSYSNLVRAQHPGALDTTLTHYLKHDIAKEGREVNFPLSQFSTDVASPGLPLWLRSFQDFMLHDQPRDGVLYDFARDFWMRPDQYGVAPVQLFRSNPKFPECFWAAKANFIEMLAKQPHIPAVNLWEKAIFMNDTPLVRDTRLRQTETDRIAGLEYLDTLIQKKEVSSQLHIVEKQAIAITGERIDDIIWWLELAELMLSFLIMVAEYTRAIRKGEPSPHPKKLRLEWDSETHEFHLTFAP